MSKTLEYKNRDFGFEMKYPSDWEKSEGQMGTCIMFFAPIDLTNPTFRSNLNVGVQDLSILPGVHDLQSFYELNVAQMKQLFKKFKILEKASSATIDGNIGYQMVYTYKQGKKPYKIKQIWTIKNNKAYIITYTSNPKAFSKYIGTAEQIMNSFKFI